MRKQALLTAAVLIGLTAPASASGYTIWQTTCTWPTCAAHNITQITLFFTTASAASTYINNVILKTYPCPGSPTKICFNQGLEATSSECATEAASNRKGGYFFCVTPWAGAAPTPRPGQSLLKW
jgi:hypothetical protein